MKRSFARATGLIVMAVTLALTLPLLRAGGVRAVTATGVLGDPTGANPIEGEALLDELAAAVIHDVQTWRTTRTDAVREIPR